MVKTNQKRVVVVQWKRFAGTDIDVFSSLKNFCDSYPVFNYHTLSNYLTKKKVPFENDEVRIERKALINHKLEKPALPGVLFWDMDYEKIDWQRAYLSIIERVLDKGDTAEWEEMIRFYGEEKVLYALKHEISYLTDMTVDAVCARFQLSKPMLKCYTKKQLNPQHWI